MAADDIENRNLGPGQQLNFSQSGGSGNTQYNAHTQNHYYTSTAATQREQPLSCADVLCSGLTRPDVDREALIYAKGKKVEGTCEWIEQNGEYVAFLHGDARMLWICGGPGKGKTMISIYLTQLLELRQRVVYFFCQAGNEKRAAATYVLRSLLWQLVTKQPELCEHLGPDLDTQEKRQVTLNSRDTLWLLFVRVIQDPRLEAVICLVDGLDECEEDSQHWLATRFGELNSAPDSNLSQISLRTIVVSRPGIPFSKNSRNIRLDPDNDQQVSRDIKTFVSSKVQMLSERLETHPATDNAPARQRLEDALLSRAEGTFLWVGLAMVELLKKRTWRDVEDTLHEIPKGLPALYDRMLNSIEPKHHQACSSILLILTVAVRPFSMQELSDAFDHQGAPGGLGDLEILRARIAACGPLVHVSNGTVTLIHESVRDYLLMSRAENERLLGPFGWSSSWAHLQLASACVACILWHGEERIQNLYTMHGEARVQNLNLMRDRLKDSAKTNAFLIYCLEYWPEHARESGDYGQKLLDDHPLFFGENSKARDAWWYVYANHHLRYKYRGDIASIRSLLHIACALDFTSWAHRLLLGHYTRSLRWVKVWRANRRAGSGPTPLYIAANLGHLNVAKLLLEHHAGVNRKSYPSTRQGYFLGFYQSETPLHTAAESHHALLVQLLLDHGASVETKRRYDECTALHLAAKKGGRATTQLLLARGAEIGARDSEGSTPLHRLTGWYGDDTDLLSLLVKYGASVTAADQSGTTPLHKAARWGHLAMARALIEYGAEINARDDSTDIPLHSAALSQISIQVIRLLLEQGATLHLENRDGFTPLHVAVYAGNVPGVKVLIEYGADFISKSRKGATALHVAAGNTFGTTQLSEDDALNVLLILLERKADIRARDVCDQTPLHWAFEVKDRRVRTEAFEPIVRTLLEWGADVNAQDVNGNCPLHLCVKIGLREIGRLQKKASYHVPVLLSPVTQLLLENGADPRAKNRTGRTPFHLVEKKHKIIFATHDRHRNVWQDIKTWYTLITPS